MSCVRAGRGVACMAGATHQHLASARVIGSARSVPQGSCQAWLGSSGGTPSVLHGTRHSRNNSAHNSRKLAPRNCFLTRRLAVLKGSSVIALGSLPSSSRITVQSQAEAASTGTAESDVAEQANRNGEASPPADTTAADGSKSEPPDVPEVEYPPTYVTAEGRIIAIGDVHGDLTKTLQSLELAGVLGRDDSGRPIWVGGNTVVVQMGDVMDRGDCEIGIVMLLRQLHKMAQKDGGAVYMLNGNHESLNVCGDYRYVTAGAFHEAAMAAGLKDEQAETWENQLRARVRLYSPGGPMAMELSKNPTVLVVNDNVFAHGGLLPEHVSYGLERMNREVCQWMRGEKLEDGSTAAPPFMAMGDSNSIMWNRMYSRERFPSPYERFHTCNLLAQALDELNAARLIVGHTPQMEGANCECDQRIWRVDVGMSGGVLDASAEVLEINGKGENAICRVVSAGSTSKIGAKRF